MTVNTTNTETKTLADGIEVTFNFDFQSLTIDWVFASTITAGGAEFQRTDITVTLNADQETSPGGTVTFDTAPDSGLTVRLYRITPLTQLTDYTDYDAFPAESHEDALDKLTFITQETEDGGGSTSSDFFEILLNHTTDAATKGSYRLQYRDFVGSPVFFLEPTNTDNDRSVIVTTAEPGTVHQFDFSRDGFFATEAIQVFTPGFSNEAVRYDFFDDGGQATATFAPVSVDKTHAYRFTADSTTGLEIYTGFRATGTAYGEDPTQLDEFVTLDFFNNNTPGQGGIVNLINQTNAEVVRINYDVVVANVVTFTPVDANKLTFYNFYVDTTTGAEVVIAFKNDGRIGLPTAPVDNEDAVRLEDLNGILDAPDLTGVVDIINQTEPAKQYSISVDTIAGGNTFALFPNANNSGITWQTRSSGGTNFDWFFSNAGLTTLPGQLSLAGNRIVSVGNATAGTDALNRNTGDSRYVQPADWEVKIASIRYQNATAIGTQRGATASKGATGVWTVTLSPAASSANNIRCQITPVDGVLAHFTVGYTVNSSSSITVTLRNATSNALADGEFTMDIWDNG